MEVTIIRNVELSMDEQKKYEVSKSLTDYPAPNKQRTAITLDCTVRHINRSLKATKSRAKHILFMVTEDVSQLNILPVSELISFRNVAATILVQAFYPIVKRSLVNVMVKTPLEIWQSTLAAFHDQAVL